MTNDFETMRRALATLLMSVMEADHWRELEAGEEGDGPVVQAHYALELPFPAALKEYLEDDHTTYVTVACFDGNFMAVQCTWITQDNGGFWRSMMIGNDRYDHAKDAEIFARGVAISRKRPYHDYNVGVGESEIDPMEP